MDDQNKNEQQGNSEGVSRRDVIKGLATIPVLGGVIYSAYRKMKYDRILRSSIFSEIGVTPDSGPSSDFVQPDRSKQIRVGVIGFGIRGEQLVRAAGFATEEWMNTQKERAEKTGNDVTLKTFLDQDNLNIVFNGVCDIFDVRNDLVQKTVSNVGHEAKKYHNWEDLAGIDPACARRQTADAGAGGGAGPGLARFPEKVKETQA